MDINKSQSLPIKLSLFNEHKNFLIQHKIYSRERLEK